MKVSTTNFIKTYRKFLLVGLAFALTGCFTFSFIKRKVTTSDVEEIDNKDYPQLSVVSRTSVDLNCELEPGLGTAIDDKGIVSLSNYQLSDASFDHRYDMIISPDNTGCYVGKRIELENANTRLNYEDSVVRYSNDGFVSMSVMTFKLTFAYNFDNSDPNYGLYFKANKSSISKANSREINDMDIIHGFRMAFVGDSIDSSTRVWADQQRSSYCKHVSAELVRGAALNGTEYDDFYLMDSEYNDDVPSVSNVTTMDYQPNFLGEFKFVPNTTSQLTYTVVCWFEGTDPTITNSNAENMNSIVAILSFGIAPLID